MHEYPSLPSIGLVVLNSTQPYCGYQTDPYNHSTPKSIRKKILPNRILETSIYKRGWGLGGCLSTGFYFGPRTPLQSF